MQKAIEEQDFHKKRYEDQMSRISASKETILSQEHVIKTRSDYIKDASKSAPKLTKELMVYLQDLWYKKERLLHKNKQLKILIEMNDGKLPRDYLENV